MASLFLARCTNSSRCSLTKAPLNRYSSRRIIVLNPSTCLTAMSLCVAGRRRAPLPVPALIESSARGADCRLRQFGRTLIRVVNVLAYRTIPAGPRIYLGIQMHRNLIPKSRPSATFPHALLLFEVFQHARRLPESQSRASKLAASQLLAFTRSNSEA